jgi:hypothetical protein
VHGLATSYYLARYQGVKNIAVLEKGYLGGGSDTDGWITSACYSPNLEFNGDSLGMKEITGASQDTFGTYSPHPHRMPTIWHGPLVTPHEPPQLRPEIQLHRHRGNRGWG